MATVKYTIEIYSLNLVTNAFQRIDVISRGFIDLTYFNKLNGIGSAAFRLACKHKKANTANLRRFVNQICIKRNDTVVWFGPITDIQSEYDNVAGYVTITANSYLYHLKTRNTLKLVAVGSQDISTTIWAQIAATQAKTNGNLLISQGTLQTSVSYPATFEYAVIADKLIEYSTYASGFDFLLTPTINGSNLVTGIRFDTFYPRLGTLRTDLNPLRVGKNVKRFVTKTDKDIVNSATAEGAGTGEETVASTLDFGSSQIAYTRRENILSFKDETQPALLTARLQTYLNSTSVENYQIDIELMPQKKPFFGEYSLGDILAIDLQITGSDLRYTGNARVVELSISVDSQGKESIIPKVNFYN